jgi:hypothetical protein
VWPGHDSAVGRQVSAAGIYGAPYWRRMRGRNVATFRRRMALSISHALRRVPVLEIEFTIQGGNADPEHVRCFFA